MLSAGNEIINYQHSVTMKVKKKGLNSTLMSCQWINHVCGDF